MTPVVNEIGGMSMGCWSLRTPEQTQVGALAECHSDKGRSSVASVLLLAKAERLQNFGADGLGGFRFTPRTILHANHGTLQPCLEKPPDSWARAQRFVGMMPY